MYEKLLKYIEESVENNKESLTIDEVNKILDAFIKVKTLIRLDEEE